MNRNTERIQEVTARLVNIATKEDIMTAIRMISERVERLSEQFNTMNGRITSMESVNTGQARQRAATGALYGYAIAGVTVIIAVVSIVITFILH
jgi:hypothetical protein